MILLVEQKTQKTANMMQVTERIFESEIALEDFCTDRRQSNPLCGPFHSCGEVAYGTVSYKSK